MDFHSDAVKPHPLQINTAVTVNTIMALIGTFPRNANYLERKRGCSFSPLCVPTGPGIGLQLLKNATKIFVFCFQCHHIPDDTENESYGVARW